MYTWPKYIKCGSFSDQAWNVHRSNDKNFLISCRGNLKVSAMTYKVKTGVRSDNEKLKHRLAKYGHFFRCKKWFKSRFLKFFISPNSRISSDLSLDSNNPDAKKGLLPKKIGWLDVQKNCLLNFIGDQGNVIFFRKSCCAWITLDFFRIYYFIVRQD